MVALLLAGVLLCVFMSIRASNDAAHSLGPQTLGVVGQEAWIADERGLVVTNAQGDIEWQRTNAELGVKGIATILAVDQERVLISSRDDAVLKLVSAKDAAPLRNIALQFPADFSHRANHVIWMSTRPVGDAGHFELAVSTGGDDAVLRFSDEGRFLARTKEGMYHFTNGIWFADGGWWTTDTNRFILRKLDAETMAQTQEVTLPGGRYLGMAVASQGEAAADGNAPLATIGLFQNGMLKGQVADVYPDAGERTYPLPAGAEPMDLGWLNKELLVVDGNAGTLFRFNQARQAMGEFGSAALRARFAESHDNRAGAKRAHTLWLAGAVSVFLFALALLLLARRATSAEREALPALAVPDFKTMARLTATGMWPQFLMLAIALVLRLSAGSLHVWFPFLFSKTSNALVIFTIFLCVLVLLLSWTSFRLHHQVRDPQFEPLFNYRALRWLHASGDWRKVLRAGEFPQEVIACSGGRGGILLLTNERLIYFRLGIGAAATEFVGERADIRSAEFDAGDAKSGWRRLKQVLTGARLTVHLRDGTKKSFRASPVTTASRMTALLASAPAAQVQGAVSSAKPGTRAHQPGVGSVGLQVFAAALFPGLGQWLQRRNDRALVFFVGAMFMLVFMVLPVAWALVARFAAVGQGTIVSMLSCWVALCCLSAAETWTMRGIHLTHSGAD